MADKHHCLTCGAPQSSPGVCRVAFEVILDAVLWCTAEAVIAGCNPAAEMLFGWREDELVGRPVDAVLPGLFAQPGIPLCGRAADTPTWRPLKVELEAASRDGAGSKVEGTARWVRSEPEPLLVVVLRGAADQRGAVAALRRSRARYRAILDAIPDLMFEVDADGRFLDVWAPSPEATYRRDFVGRSVPEVLPAAASEVIMGALAEAVEHGRHSGAVFSLAMPDGQHWFELSAARKDGGRSAVVLSRDITARHTAQSQLRSSEERFARVFHSTGSIITISQVDSGVFLDVNEAFTAATGYLREEAIGRSSLELGIVSSELRDQLKGDLARAGALRAVRFPLSTRDGVAAMCVGNLDVITVDGRDRLLFVGQDVTELERGQGERRELERHLQRGQQLESLGLLAGGIAHDFNNLLMAIMGNAELALDRLAEGSPAAERVRDIMTTAQHAAGLAGQMLAYSGRGSLVKSVHDLSQLVDDMAKLLRASVGKRVTLNLDLATRLPSVEMDVTQIRQVVLNLITNASEAIGDADGVVALETRCEELGREQLRSTFVDDDLPAGRYVVLVVRDTGSGMDRATLDRIFDPFFTTKVTGRGLGLAILLGIIRSHRGAITVASAPGRGTTFKVMLPPAPAVQADRRQVAAAQASPELPGGRTVLLVDDEPAVRSVASRMLQRLGFMVVEAVDGVEALAVFDQRRAEIDLVILDLKMPRMGGDEVLGRLRELAPDLPVILSSGHTADEARSPVGARVAGFIQKPYRLNDLRQRVDEALER